MHAIMFNTTTVKVNAWTADNVASWIKGVFMFHKNSINLKSLRAS